MFSFYAKVSHKEFSEVAMKYAPKMVSGGKIEEAVTGTPTMNMTFVDIGNDEIGELAVKVGAKVTSAKMPGNVLTLAALRPDAKSEIFDYDLLGLWGGTDV